METGTREGKRLAQTCPREKDQAETKPRLSDSKSIPMPLYYPAFLHSVHSHGGLLSVRGYGSDGKGAMGKLTEKPLKLLWHPIHLRQVEGKEGQRSTWRGWLRGWEEIGSRQ